MSRRTNKHAPAQFVCPVSSPSKETSVFPPALLILKISSSSNSKISVSPDVELSISKDLTFVSIGLSAPNPVTTSATNLPFAASISSHALESPPMLVNSGGNAVSPSTTPPLLDVSVTAASEALLVSTRPRVISSSAERAKIPEPALNTVPSTMVKAPPDVFLSRSLSAETVIFPVVVIKSPAAVKMMSSSALRLIKPPTDPAPVTLKELSPPTVTLRSLPTVEVERVTELLLVSVASPVPEVFKFTAPVNALDLLSRVIT